MILSCLMPEAISAIRASLKNELQRGLNIALGSACATIGMTIPAVAMASLITGRSRRLGSVQATRPCFFCLAMVWLASAQDARLFSQGFPFGHFCCLHSIDCRSVVVFCGAFERYAPWVLMGCAPLVLCKCDSNDRAYWLRGRSSLVSRSARSARLAEHLRPFTETEQAIKRAVILAFEGWSKSEALAFNLRSEFRIQRYADPYATSEFRVRNILAMSAWRFDIVKRTTCQQSR